MEIIYAIFVGLLGLSVGSFLNVVIYRTPLELSVVKPNSFCPKCKNNIKWYDNIPVLSYILLRGKCRFCGEHISFRYTLVEITNCVLWLLSFFIYYKTSLIFAFICMAVSSILICVCFIDLEHKIILDRFQIMLLILGIASIFSGDGISYIDRLIGFGVGGGLFLIVYGISYLVYKREALGRGDIKLAFVMGLVLGYKGIILSILIASIVGAITLTILSKKNNNEKGHEYPFAPFLVIGMLIALFTGNVIVDWYLGLFAI